MINININKITERNDMKNIKEDQITTLKVNKLGRALVLLFMDMGLSFEEAETKANRLFHHNFISDKPQIGKPNVTWI